MISGGLRCDCIVVRYWIEFNQPPPFPRKWIDGPSPQGQVLPLPNKYLLIPSSHDCNCVYILILPIKQRCLKRPRDAIVVVVVVIVVAVAVARGVLSSHSPALIVAFLFAVHCFAVAAAAVLGVAAVEEEVVVVVVEAIVVLVVCPKRNCAVAKQKEDEGQGTKIVRMTAGWLSVETVVVAVESHSACNLSGQQEKAGVV